jgi:hypothetical protein
VALKLMASLRPPWLTTFSRPSRELLARRLFRHRFVNFSAKTKREFSNFDFSQIVILRFDRNEPITATRCR